MTPARRQRLDKGQATSCRAERVAAAGFTEQATAVVSAGLAAGEDPREAARAALALHAYETAFWDTLADGLG